MPTGGINDYVSPAMPEFEYPKLDFRDRNLADYFCEIVVEKVKQFEAALDNDHEVALLLASFGRDIPLNVVSIGYSNPSTLIFRGFVAGQPATLIQHVSQLNFLMLAVQKADPNEPPRRLAGFSSEENEKWRKG